MKFIILALLILPMLVLLGIKLYYKVQIFSLKCKLRNQKAIMSCMDELIKKHQIG